MADFIVDRFPQADDRVELLCVDHNGTYVVPFSCRRVDEGWANAGTNERIEAEVLGWRPKLARFRTRADAHQRP